MCGIFGVVVRQKNKHSLAELKTDIELLSLLSQNRGQDSAGLVVQSGSEVSVLRRGGKAKEMVKDLRFSKAIQDGYNQPSETMAVIGHSRLVTNGSMGIDDNNQPIVAGDIIGIHNGIITNATEHTDHATTESIWSESDTKVFYQKVWQHKENGLDTQSSLASVLKQIEGSASIAAIDTKAENLFLATNTGSLYYIETDAFLVFLSEKQLLNQFIRSSLLLGHNGTQSNQIKQLPVGHILKRKYMDSSSILADYRSVNKDSTENKIHHTININKFTSTVRNLKRCTKCILPETYPLISFDDKGVCNFCRRYSKQVVHGEAALEKFLEKYRSKDGSPDCLVGLSGGRDSCYGLHVLKTKYGMHPIAYTFDWGLTTDISRRNQAKVCGRLGIEHIVRAPDIQKKRSYVRKNVHAFLKRPHLGMVPLFMAGDKDFYHFGRKLRDDNQLPLTVFCSGHSLEQRDFMTGFCGVDENIQNNKRLYKFSAANKIKLAMFYVFQYLKNPAYINASLLDSIRSFIYSFISRDDFLYLFEYLPWNEAEIEKLLNEEYQWEADKKYGKNQWRMGDGQTAFTNYIYYTVAGFSEFDNFRSNQIREGMITRDQALKLVEHDNQPKWDALSYFSHVIGINLDEVLRDINNIPKMY